MTEERKRQIEAMDLPELEAALAAVYDQMEVIWAAHPMPEKREGDSSIDVVITAIFGAPEMPQEYWDLAEQQEMIEERIEEWETNV